VQFDEIAATDSMESKRPGFQPSLPNSPKVGSGCSSRKSFPPHAFVRYKNVSIMETQHNLPRVLAFGEAGHSVGIERQKRPIARIVSTQDPDNLPHLESVSFSVKPPAAS